MWIGEPYYEDERDRRPDLARRGRPRPAPGEVGPVAWSEGMRMAAALYAGREIEEGKDA